MSEVILNKVLLENNDCLGCGHENPHGYKIEVYEKEGVVDELFGHFDPPDYSIGFPGIIHGGAIYTVFDCIAAWVPLYFRKDVKAVWMLKGAEMSYYRPAYQGKRIKLHAKITAEGDRWEPKTVTVDALNMDDELLSRGLFTFIPISVERFKFVSGIKDIPENWETFIKGDRLPIDTEGN